MSIFIRGNRDIRLKKGLQAGSEMINYNIELMRSSGFFFPFIQGRTDPGSRRPEADPARKTDGFSEIQPGIGRKGNQR